MATMNKPAANDSNWYQAYTDNWTAIENFLVDTSAFIAKGDLIAASGAATPTRVGVGANDQMLTADSSKRSGVKWAGAIGLSEAAYMDTVVLGKRFFSAAGLMP